MPELPEVETVVRGIRPQAVGRTILSVRRASPLMARSQVGPFRRGLVGRRFLALDRHGKWMFFRLSGDRTLVVHLGMTGRLEVTPAATPALPHTHLRLALDRGDEELRFSDPRRFGELWLAGPAHLEERFGPKRLGPEALAIDALSWRTTLAATKRKLKVVLLDQRAVAGIGNIYADEILFDAGLSPAALANRVGDQAAEALRRAIGRVLRRAIRCQGTSIRDYVTAQGVPGEFQDRLKVYGRAGEPCKRCRGAIVLDRSIVAGRATYWCPNCQTGSPAAEGRG